MEKPIYVFNDKVVGDRVEIVTYFKDSPKEYVFDRFLPLEWEPFIDLFAIVFSYLPRGMEIFLHEIFAKFDGTEERFNCSKPIKFDLLLDDMNETFRKMVVSRGEKLFEDNKVKFVERQDDDYYIGLVEEEGKSFVPIVKKVDDEDSVDGEKDKDLTLLTFVDSMRIQQASANYNK